MKVVIFCGGQGLRLRDYSENVPKPMVPVGSRPILWHMMKYYAHYGHKDFILCLGYRADAVKDYFLNYNECMNNDFVLSRGGQNVKTLSSDISDWNITFCDTGANTLIGQRLVKVKEHLGNDERFMCNYADSVIDLPLPTYLDFATKQDKIASFMSVRPSTSFHVVQAGADGMVNAIKPAQDLDLWVNGGYFVLKREIFDHIRPGEELVNQPFERLIKMGQLATYKHNGFWACMDTFKEKMVLDEMVAKENAPWMVWTRPETAEVKSA